VNSPGEIRSIRVPDNVITFLNQRRIFRHFPQLLGNQLDPKHRYCFVVLLARHSVMIQKPQQTRTHPFNRSLGIQAL
jgi:hypothetical protein